MLLLLTVAGRFDSPPQIGFDTLARRETSVPTGFSELAMLVMNSNMPVASRGRSGGTTRTPVLPTTTASPVRIMPIGTQDALFPSNTIAQSISGRETSTQEPSTLTKVGWLVVE